MNLTYEILKNYLKKLSEKNKRINDFSGFTYTELSAKVSGNNMRYPAMVLNSYKGRLKGVSQRTFNVREISFSILIQTSGNVLDIETKQALAESIGLSVLQRIHTESQENEVKWLYRNFDANTVEYSEIEYDNKDRVTGMEFYFDLKTKQNFEMDLNDWSDKSNVAFSPGFNLGFK